MIRFWRSGRSGFGAALIAGLTMVALFSASGARAAPVAADAKGVDLTIYHAIQTRSWRIIWLCEELGIPYKLVFTNGEHPGANLREINPLMPTSPTVAYKGQILNESGGIMDVILAHYGKGRLVPPVSSPDFNTHTMWMHWAEGTGLYRIYAHRYASVLAKIPLDKMPQGYEAGNPSGGVVGVKAALVFMEDFLSKHPYFGGERFSAADIIMHFVVRSTGQTAGVPSSDYAHIVAWRKRVEARPAFKRTIGIAFPSGSDDNQNACGGRIPFADPPRVFECTDEQKARSRWALEF